jgi:hypothetical protein
MTSSAYHQEEMVSVTPLCCRLAENPFGFIPPTNDIRTGATRFHSQATITSPMRFGLVAPGSARTTRRIISSIWTKFETTSCRAR